MINKGRYFEKVMKPGLLIEISVIGISTKWINTNIERKDKIKLPKITKNQNTIQSFSSPFRHLFINIFMI